MDDYLDFLRSEVLSEKKIITYRLLSRSLKVHVNLAKEMLHDFHATENKTVPGSVHATYLLTGYRRIRNEDEDIEMSLSPWESTQKGEGSAAMVVVVVPQEKLEDAKRSFIRLNSVHVYSLECAKLTDLTIIAGACQEVLTKFLGAEDPEKMADVYGSITNPAAKQRSACTRMVLPNAPPVPVAAKKLPEPITAKKPAPATATATSMFSKNPTKKQETTSEAKVDPQPGPKPTPATAPANKTQKAFFSNWNTANKKAKDRRAESQSNSSTHSPAPEPVPVKMETDTEGEADDGDEKPTAHDIAEESRKRKARQQELEAMMDSSNDSDGEPTPLPPKKAPSPSPPPSAVKKSEPPEPQPTTKRRGKRKVMKKITTKDDEGYLCTRMEATWESCSDAETEPPPKPAATKPAPVQQKGKKAKSAGQGNITSFFRKK